MKARLSVRKLCTFTLSVAVLVTLWQFSAGVHAQKAGKAKNADPPAVADAKAAKRNEAAVNNAEYAAKIK